MGERDTLTNRLKALTDNTLAAFEDASKVHQVGIESTPSLARVAVEHEDLQNQAKRNLLNSFLKKLSPKQKERNEKIAWICRTQFANGSFCHTINGTHKNAEVIKKTCSKCKQWRNSPLSIYEELMAEVLEGLRKAGINTEGLEL